jgi:hypothetical protein
MLNMAENGMAGFAQLCRIADICLSGPNRPFSTLNQSGPLLEEPAASVLRDADSVKPRSGQSVCSSSRATSLNSFIESSPASCPFPLFINS